MRRARGEKADLPADDAYAASQIHAPDEKLARGSPQRFAIYGAMFFIVVGLMWLIGNRVVLRTDLLDSPPSLRPMHAGGGEGPGSSRSRGADIATSKSAGEPAPRPAGEPPGPRYGVYSSDKKKDSDLDAVLEELLALHRKDEAEREPPTLPPEDLPAFHSEDSLVVSMADGGYAACAVRLLESVRGAGRYEGALAVLVPTGDGTVPLPAAEEGRLQELGAALVPVPPDVFGGSEVHGAGSAVQYGKIKLLVDSSFRRYASILFLDADGVVGAPLQPLLELPLPTGRPVALPTWPSATMEHESFYTREINLRALSTEAAASLRLASPDRTLVGITAWFLLRTAQLPSPERMRLEVDAALRRWRPSFRFNDQGLFNVLFYNTSAFFPSCVSGPEPKKRATPSSSSGEKGPAAHLALEFQPFIVENLDNLAQAIETSCGPREAPRRPMYYHGLKDCVPEAEWQRKMKQRRSNPGHDQQDLMEAYDRGQRRLGHRQTNRF